MLTDGRRSRVHRPSWRTVRRGLAQARNWGGRGKRMDPESAGVSGIERAANEEAPHDDVDVFEWAFTHSVVPKSITSPTGEARVNPAFCEMLGYTPDELGDETTWTTPMWSERAWACSMRTPSSSPRSHLAPGPPREGRGAGDGLPSVRSRGGCGDSCGDSQ